MWCFIQETDEIYSKLTYCCHVTQNMSLKPHFFSSESIDSSVMCKLHQYYVMLLAYEDISLLLLDLLITWACVVMQC